MAGIVSKTKWKFKYIDLNSLTFSACKNSNLTIPKWDSSNQLEIFNLTKEIFQEKLHDTFMNEIQKWGPDLIGFSLINSNRHFAILALREFEKIGNTVPVIFGGPDCFPREYHLNYIAERCPPDIMLQGEAEIALPKFLNEYQTTKKIQTQIPGYIYKGRDGAIIDSGLPELSFLKENSIKADYSIFNYAEIACEGDNAITIFSSKGCINKCAFCSESRNYQPYRRRNASEVIEEVEKNLANLPRSTKGIAEVSFRDSIFNASAAYLREICELIITKKLNFHWGCLGAFKTAMPTELLNLMHCSGCRSIFFGFESASQRVIDLMGKNFCIIQAQQIIENCLFHEINVALPIINGFPGEFTRDFLTTVAFILRYRDREYLKFNYSNVCGVYKGTPLSDYPQDFLIEELHETQYTLQDKLSTPLTRQLRQSLTDALIRKINISSCLEVTNNNFNDVAVATELAKIIFFASTFLHEEAKAKSFFENLGKEEGCLQTSSLCGDTSHVVNSIPGVDLRQWFVADKNTHQTKGKILFFLDDIFQELAATILAPENINFQVVRDSLYNITPPNHLATPPAGFQINSIRLSQYDGGNHIIFAGSLDEATSGSNLSWLEAKCGDYYFDIHCGTDIYFPPSRKNKFGRIHFWGKIHKKKIRENGLVFSIMYHDKRYETFTYRIDTLLNGNKVRQESFSKRILSFLGR